MEYNGVEACMLKNQCYENEYSVSTESCATDTVEDDRTSCSSSKDDSGSFCSDWMVKKKDEKPLDEWKVVKMHKPPYTKDKKAYVIRCSDVGTMKEKFAKLLLGEDISGGSKGLSTAVALSNSITSLAASTFGELWKLQSLPEDRRIRWQKEMDWLLSPTKSMVELVPAKQNGVNGGLLEIMVPRARKDIQMNLPALQKLDSMLIDTLEAMENTEFWYDEGGSRVEGSLQNTRKRWWLPSPRVPDSGLAPTSRKSLLSQASVVNQIFKAAKSINQSVLEEMHIPTFIREALPKSAKASLGGELHKALASPSSSAEQALVSVKLDDEHRVLEVVNRLEAAAFQWKERIEERGCGNGRSLVRAPWPLLRDTETDVEKAQRLLARALDLIFFLKSRHPNLPQTFLQAIKVQYCKDVGHSILESYSRALSGVAFTILVRIVDVLREDSSTNPHPAFFSGVNLSQMSGSSTRRQVSTDEAGDREERSRKCEGKGSIVGTGGSRSTMWCGWREACGNNPMEDSP